MQRQTRVLILNLTGCLKLSSLSLDRGAWTRRLAEASQGPLPEPEVGATYPEVHGHQNKRIPWEVGRRGETLDKQPRRRKKATVKIQEFSKPQKLLFFHSHLYSKVISGLATRLVQIPFNQDEFLA